MLRLILVYGSSTAMQRALAFLAVPLLSGYLSLAALGHYSLTQTLAQLAIPLLTMNCTVALAREAYDNPRAAARLLNGVVALAGGAALAATAVAWLVGAPDWIVLGCALGGGEACFAACTGALQGREAAYRVFVVSMIKTAGMTAAIAATPFAHLSWQALVGLLIANSLLASIIAFALARHTLRTASTTDDREDVPLETMVRYSAATLPHTMALWVSVSADRMLLGALKGSAAVGAYAVVHPLALSIMLLMSGVISALPTRIAADPDAWTDPVQPIRLIWHLTVISAGFTLVGVIALKANEWLAIFPIAQPHHILVFACLCVAFYGSFYYVLFSSYLYLKRSTGALSRAGFVLAPLNLGAMAVLVMLGGGVGAALGVIVCYVSFAVGYYRYAVRLVPELRPVGRAAIRHAATLAIGAVTLGAVL